jgi:hypothetical protein
MEIKKQVNDKINVIFGKFLEDKDIFNKNSFLEKLLLFSANKNLKAYLKYIKILSWAFGIISLFSLIFIINKAKTVKKNIPLNENDIGQVKLALIVFGFFAIGLMIMILLHVIVEVITGQKSLKEIISDSQKQCFQRLEYYFDNKSKSHSEISPQKQRSNVLDDGDMDNFIVESLISYFQFLIRKTDKRKDSTDACLPLVTLILILISVFVIGLPKIPGLEQLPSYYGFPTFAAFINAIYKPVIALSSNNLSIKYSKCLLKIENLKSVRSMDHVKIEEALKLVS